MTKQELMDRVKGDGISLPLTHDQESEIQKDVATAYAYAYDLRFVDESSGVTPETWQEIRGKAHEEQTEFHVSTPTQEQIKQALHREQQKRRVPNGYNPDLVFADESSGLTEEMTQSLKESFHK